MTDASSTDGGLPVTGEMRINTPEARSRPLSRFSGNDAIHFTPATRKSEPRYAGSAMILSRGWFGKRRNVEWGSEHSPNSCV